MKYTLKYILDTRYDKNRNKTRILQERFIPLNVIVKFLSPYTTYLFLNLGIKADVVTFLSILFVIGGAAAFVLGNVILAIIFIFIFTLFDSTDGDMARCTKPSKYGGTLDSFGADFFYALVPSSVGYYIYSEGISFALVDNTIFLFAGVIASLTFLLYRLINTKMISFLREHEKITKDFFTKTHFEQNTPSRSFIFKLVKLYRHELVKGNFFSEPGIAFWLIVLIILSQFEVLGYYLIIIALYNIGYLLINLVRTYLIFLKT
tara:strand:- start:355 stop:1140 length:786 start_codon:yes stop_codon:yes gene_type:complete